MAYYSFFLASSLEKVFPSQRPSALESRSFRLLRGERLSFQLVYTTGSDPENSSAWQHFNVRCEGAPVKPRMREVTLVPSEFPCWGDHDENYLTTQPGLFPDLLLPSDGRILPIPGQFRSLWIDLSLDGVQAGSYPLTLSVEAEQSTLLGNGSTESGQDAARWNWSTTLTLEVLAAELPPQTLLHTEWLHVDCLIHQYRLTFDDVRFWQVVERYIAFAGDECGINTLLTPIFTPPLDTMFGGERETVQLVDVEKNGDGYRFGFDKLKRWCELCRKHGITHLELAHFFTQWGAVATPKIMVKENGVLKRAFGWDVPAQSESYRAFLQAFVPTLLSFLYGLGYQRQQIFFHISDEPAADKLDNFMAARRQIEDLLDGCPVIDALSTYAFYERGLVKHPVCSNDSIQQFIDHQVPELWVYYCCAQGRDVPNRFFAMPSARNRIMGLLMYYYDVKGFLHWGYNFYNSQFSRRPIDPYRVTDSGFAFPSGDPFLVYPGEDGAPISSIRNEVQMDGLSDMRALQALECLTDRASVRRLIDEQIGYQPTFTRYPRSTEWLLRFRAKVNDLISEKSK